MAKMASLHAEMYSIPEPELPTCYWCGDSLDVCAEAEECPVSFTR